MWAARRFRLQVDLGYADSDERPDPQTVIAMMMLLLSGRAARPVREQWRELTAQRIDDTLASAQPTGAGYRLSVRALILGESAVAHMPLGADEVPILDGVQIRERPFAPHFGLTLELAGPLTPPFERRIKDLLSGPASVPVQERWSELTARLVSGLLIRKLPGLQLSSVTLRIGDRASDRIVLAPGSVPVLDAIRVEV
jgi:hypothetical protein